jgi:hypothetical protein
MTQRERILGIAVAALALLMGGNWLWSKYSRSIAAKRTQLLTAQDRLGQAKLAYAQGEDAAFRLADWQDQSLPADREVAQSLYRVWLETQFKAAGLAADEFQPAQRLAPAAGYSAVGYTVNARGTLKSLTNFLDAYYRSKLLQQITRLQVRPDLAPGQLRISLQTEALILPGTINKTLPEGVVDRPVRPKAADYAAAIDSRNIFTVYRPPRPTPPPTVARATPPRPKFDDAKFAFFSGIVGSEDNRQAWIDLRTKGETLRLHAGDDIKVGEFEGKVLSIDLRAMTVKVGDEEIRVNLGETLRDGKPVAKTDAG